MRTSGFAAARSSTQTPACSGQAAHANTGRLSYAAGMV